MTSTDFPRVRGQRAWLRTSLAILMVSGLLACCGPVAAQTAMPTCSPQGRALVPCGLGFDLCLDVRAEYLLWWTRSMHVPALVTTSPADTDRDEAGVLGQATTEVLFGGSGLNGDARSGGRFAVDGWFDPCRSLGFELGYAFLEQESAAYAAASEGDPILARPFFNADTNLEDAGLIAFPDVAEGSIAIDAATRFGTAEAVLVKTLLDACGRRVAFRLGYRYAELEDELTISEQMTSTEVATAGTTLDLFDRFDASNTFNGPQLGLIAEQQVGCWSIELLTKLAFGTVHSEVDIQGSTTTTTATGASSTAAGGFLALPTNIGHYERDGFSSLAELGLKLTYAFGCHWRASFGYSFLYWHHVARAGDQIDRTLSAGEFPPGQGGNSLHPEFPFATTGFWAQGMNFGVEYRY